jgi:hypothetical protein
MGAALVLEVRVEGWRSPLARQIALCIVLIVAYGMRTRGIDNAAHLGGMVAGGVVASAWRRGVQYSPTTTWLSIALSALVCIGAGAGVVWRDATDPYALRGPNERSDLVVLALRRHDCGGARRALVATETVAPESPELDGLRTEVERSCPPGAP